jgi:hypothetical protein
MLAELDLVDGYTLKTMKARRLFAPLVVVAFVASQAASCSLFEQIGGRYRFVVAIDTIVVADSIGPSDTLFVGLRGVIATDGCASFDGMEKTRNAGTIDYKVYALHDDRRICVQSLILFNRTDTVLPPQVNPTLIRAIQPEGAFPASRTVIVK